MPRRHMARRYLEMDVFADRPGAGNPLVVIPDSDGLDASRMQAIARWTRRPETTFLFPPTVEGASYRVRMFSPEREVPFAGHPSIGTAHAVLELGLAAPVDGLLWQQGETGVLPLAVRGEGPGRTIAVRVPRARVVEVADPDDARIIAILAGTPVGPLPPALMDGGRRWWVAELASEAALRGLQPDWDAVAALAGSTGSMGLCAFARADAGQGHDLAVRALVGAGPRFEDAASGAANATLAAWLRHNDAVPGGRLEYVASQGREVGYDARLHLRIDRDGDVWSGGEVRDIVRGTLDWD